MSMYHNQQGYGHNAYGHVQQVPLQLSSAQYPYHSPHYAQPSFIMDPNSFRRDYAARLSELTVNSRPIIQNLSVIAQEYIRYADIVSQCLEAHIRRVVPWMKLPAFYLLDAISKNVFEPYAAKFSAFVVSLFLETYHHVDHATKCKMEEMLVTWRSGAPHGKELFGVAVQVAVERSIWGGDGILNEDSSSSRRIQGSGPITKSQVLAELEVTLAQKERQIHNNPYDSNSQIHVGVLQQLRKMVEAGVSQEELSQILVQLRALSREAATIIQPPPVPPASFRSSSTTAVRSLHPSSAQQPYILQSTCPVQSTVSPYISYTTQHQAISPDVSINDFASSTSSTNNISNLLNTLLKAGLVSSNTGIASAETVSSLDRINLEPLVLASREYAKAILVKKMKLTTSELTKQGPFLLAFLHEQLPVQCKQCAIRFPDDSVGKKKMEDHLDLHFRQNRKASENIGRGHSRSWYMNLENWINDIEGDIKGKSHIELSGTTAANAEAAKQEAVLRYSFVVIPPGDEVKNVLCPICKETLKSEFLEEDEEWVWRNAVRNRDKIYHATCRAEMVASAALVAKLRDEMRSRSGTPEAADMTRSTPPGKQQISSSIRSKLRSSKSPIPEQISTSNKRKVDDTVAGETEEMAPLSKKIAVLEYISYDSENIHCK